MSALTRHGGPLVSGSALYVALVSQVANAETNLTVPGSRQAGDLMLAAWLSGSVSMTDSPDNYATRSTAASGTITGSLHSRTATNNSSDEFSRGSGNDFVGSVIALRTTGTTFTWSGSVGLAIPGASPRTATAPSITAVGAGKDIVVVTARGDVGSTFTISPPGGAGWTSLGSGTASSVNFAMKAEVFSRVVALAGATGTAAFSVASTGGNAAGAAARVLVSA
jgi:hypothetical protein